MYVGGWGVWVSVPVCVCLCTVFKGHQGRSGSKKESVASFELECVIFVCR